VSLWIGIDQEEARSALSAVSLTDFSLVYRDLLQGLIHVIQIVCIFIIAESSRRLSGRYSLPVALTAGSHPDWTGGAHLSPETSHGQWYPNLEGPADGADRRASAGSASFVSLVALLQLS